MKHMNETIRFAARAFSRGARVRAEATGLTAMRAQLAGLSTAVDTANAAYTAQLTAPDYDEAACTSAKAAYDSAVSRYRALKTLIGEEETRQRERLVPILPTETTPRADIREARGRLFRAMLGVGGTVESVMQQYRALLGSFPEGEATLNGGENFLPETVSSTLISEAFERGDILQRITTTYVQGLKMPRISYTLDDDADVMDGEVAKYLALKGDQVVFGRHVSRVYTEVSNSVLSGSVVSLDSYIMGALEDGLRVKTLRRLFATAPKEGEEHMSLYAAENAIQIVTGATLFDALIDAIADLPDAAQDAAEIAMRRTDYNAMLRELSGDESLFASKPEEILGVPVHFTNRAVYPVVGDLSQIHHNYDGLPTQDTDKVLTRGVKQFAIEADDDIQIKLPPYRRIAKLSEANA